MMNTVWLLIFLNVRLNAIDKLSRLNMQLEKESEIKEKFDGKCG